MLRLILMASALLAQLATAASLSINAMLAHQLSHLTTVGALFITSAAEAFAALLLLICLSTIHLFAPTRRLLGSHQAVIFGMGVFMSVMAAAVSMAALVYMSRATIDREELGSVDKTSMVIGASVALGVSFGFQIVFFIAHFITSRAPGSGNGTFVTADDGHYVPGLYVKGLRYSQTLPLQPRPRPTSMDSKYAPSWAPSYAPSSTASVASSMAKFIRPISSKTRLLSTREKHRGHSLDSDAYRSSTDVPTDSWDGSSVDTITLQTISTPSVAKPRFLETIPASPTISGASTPELLQDLEPPHPVRRSRSYSPSGRREVPGLTSSSSSELHIHPLFRSDSPTPPPIATPGTVVLASPIAGQVISNRQSVHSLKRIRSGSLPSAPSPLSRQGSLEPSRSTSSLRIPMDEQSSIEEVEESEEEDKDNGSARRVKTQSIPDFVLGAGNELPRSGQSMRRSTNPSA
ncbi:hypothetical protein B0I35DRAFT_37071 [Stachybotrys elegans]|uniref:MARVEL domain-containing protein n=1 Tax=Stachybotrys elegans TaxID=80388 RepID=A0A8K0T2R0_9HYPO|nr:hypothetical protein B0I35DRAFT_37071 [Stachybotrys elegans]